MGRSLFRVGHWIGRKFYAPCIIHIMALCTALIYCMTIFDSDISTLKVFENVTMITQHLMRLHNSTLTGGGNDGMRGTDNLTEFDVWSRHCAAGGLSAAASKTITAPLDRIKLYMQVTSCKEGGLMAAAEHVYRTRGVRGFWLGNGLSVLKSSPEFAIKFSVYDYVKRRLRMCRDDGCLSNGDRFMAGAAAGVISQTFLYPLETIKTRLTIGKYTNITDVVIHTYKTGGLLSFFKGVGPSTLSIFLFTGIELMTYEHIKHWQSDRLGSDQNKWSVNLTSALCSSALGVIVCYPISTIITRIQVDDSGKYEWKQRVTTSDNVRSLYRGFASSFVKVLPATAIAYVVYEELCDSFGVRMS